MTKAIAAQAAEALRESAARHKRSAASHRRECQRCMEALARLTEACANDGIAIVTGDKSGGR